MAIIGSSPSEMIEKATEVLKESNVLEFRLDYLAKPAAALPALKQFLADNGAATAIATCRLKDHGGAVRWVEDGGAGDFVEGSSGGIPPCRC